MGSLFEPGRNCWRIERAEKLSVIVDACDYFHIIRQAMRDAERRILLIGWDFDPRITLERSEDGDDESLGAFLLDVAEAKPHVAIDILKWDVGALKLLGRGSALFWLARWLGTKPISLSLDHAHPPGCSHHQKIVVIDDSFAICGGIDMTRDRWDRREHADDDPGRVEPNGDKYGPWHDVTVAIDGPLAKALGDLGRERWKVATGRDMAPVAGAAAIWPDELEPMFTGVDVAVARTRAEYGDCSEVTEIEALFLDMIAAAKRFVYAENQYFTSPKIAAAVARRMAEPDGPEFVLVGPEQADGWLEQVAMDAARVRLAHFIGQTDPGRRFRIYSPVTEGGQPIYVHAKVMIVDDTILRVGSANMNNRSLRLDSECDVAIEAGGDGPVEQAIRALRLSLMAEHLGRSTEEVERAIGEQGSLIGAIEALRGAGRTLAPLSLEMPDEMEKFIADNELLDPESPGMMFEPLTRPNSLIARFRRGSGR